MYEHLKNMFIDEVKELLTNLEKNLLDLEKNPQNQEIIYEIYRILHTIKGAAGMYNLNKTVELAHNFESVFKKIKENQITITPEIISLTLKAKDLLLNLIETDENVDPITVNNLIEQLNKIEIKPHTQAQLPTFYILFQPDKDIYDRGINLTAILEDLNKLPFSKIKALENKQNPDKHPIFWEIIAAAPEEQIKSIFIFVEDEVSITKLSDQNLFNNPNFTEIIQQLDKQPFENHKQILQQFLQKQQKTLTTSSQPQTSNQYQAQQKAKIITSYEKSELTNIQYIRIPAQSLDKLLNLVSQLIVNNSILENTIKQNNKEQIEYALEELKKITEEIKVTTFDLRMIPIDALFITYRRFTRDLAQQLGKKVKLVTEGGNIQIDKNIVEKLYTPLLHIIRNAIDHGIEPPEERIKRGKNPEGLVRLAAVQSNQFIIIQVQDDGRGIDTELIRKRAIELGIIKPTDQLTEKQLINIIFTPGFTTATNVSDISGRGMGMDIIQKSIRDLNGHIEVNSEKGLGTIVTIKVPHTLSIIDTLLVKLADFKILVPVNSILQVQRLINLELQVHSGQRIVWEGELIPYVNLRKLFKINGHPPDEQILMITDIGGGKKLALIFDEIIGDHSAVVKPMSKLLAHLEFFIGSSILGDGSVAYILDPSKLAKILS